MAINCNILNEMSETTLVSETAFCESAGLPTESGTHSRQQGGLGKVREPRGY